MKSRPTLWVSEGNVLGFVAKTHNLTRFVYNFCVMLPILDVMLDVDSQKYGYLDRYVFQNGLVCSIDRKMVVG